MSPPAPPSPPLGPPRGLIFLAAETLCAGHGPPSPADALMTHSSTNMGRMLPKYRRGSNRYLDSFSGGRFGTSRSCPS